MARKRKDEYHLFIAGARSWNKPKVIRDTIKKVADDPLLVKYVVIGNLGDAEKYAAIQAKHLGLNLAVVPANFERYGLSAEYLRDGIALQYFKPKKIIVIHKDPEQDKRMKPILKWGRTHGAEVHIIKK